MTTTELIAAVKRKILDHAYDDAKILGCLNRASLQVAGWENKDPQMGYAGSILLDALQTQWELTTNPELSFVALPADYHKHLFNVTYEGMPSHIFIYPNVRQFLHVYAGRVTNHGPVGAVTIGAGVFYYTPIPEEATELTIYGYRKPPLMDESEIDPDWIPEHLQEDLLVGHACMEIFNETEDGVEANKLNTLQYRQKFHEALARLDDFTQHKAVQIQTRTRRVRWF